MILSEKIHSLAKAKTIKFWALAAGLVALGLFLSTLQTNVNSSLHSYATDVGEIQNALPRWGLIHYSGYPLYTALASLFVAALRLLGIEPAASASLFSALWGAVTVSLIVILAHELEIKGPIAALSALATAVSTSVWVDASIAEVHTMTLALTLAILLYAVRFGRSGSKKELLLLALFFSQGVMHQRSVVIIAPAVAVLIWPQIQVLWKNLIPAISVSLLALATYLYMPLRVWMGATWFFGSPGTWDGFWALVFDNRGGRVFKLDANWDKWIKRIQTVSQILADDLLWPLLILGLATLVWIALRKGKNRRESIALTLAWIPNFLLTLVIWRGRVTDAQLAAKVPILPIASIGLALLLTWIWRRSRQAGIAASLLFTATLIIWGMQVRPFVLSITRDASIEEVIAAADQVSNPTDEQPTTMVALWGTDYWALAYAQECRDQLQGINLVDHNANHQAIVERGDRYLTVNKTFYVFPVSWWEQKLNLERLYLASAAPGVIEISPTPPITSEDVPADINFDLGNGISIRAAELNWTAQDRLRLTLYWESLQETEAEYSVAVHLVAHDPPQDPSDVLYQADAQHPIDSWYPTSRWSKGEIVRDTYALTVPEDSQPTAVRVALYRTDPETGFINSPWFSLPLPPAP